MQTPMQNRERCWLGSCGSWAFRFTSPGVVLGERRAHHTHALLCVVKQDRCHGIGTQAAQEASGHKKKQALKEDAHNTKPNFGGERESERTGF